MADDCCEDLDTASLVGRQKNILLTVLVINIVTFCMMVAGSWLSGSSSLLSGTLDNFGDSLTYAISFLVVGANTATKSKVAFFKGCLIMTAAILVAVQIAWRMAHFHAPVAETMGIVAIANLLANVACLALLTPVRHDDVNMASVWECSRNDVVEGFAVIATAGLVWFTHSAWPDVLVAAALLIFFLRSAVRVMRHALEELRETSA